jgi:phage shock protein PspC (stress-responsive transcriptional regulator)
MTAAAQITDRTPLPLRGDNFLGVCEAIGQDFGINPNWLRIAFAPFIMFSPLITLSVYLGLGAVVAAARWFFPVEVKAPAPTAKAEPVSEDAGEVEERLAA